MEINITKMLEEAAENVNAAVKFGAFVLNFRNKVSDEICIEAYYWLHWWRKELGDAMPSEGLVILDQFAKMFQNSQREIEIFFAELDKITAGAKAFEDSLSKQAADKKSQEALSFDQNMLLWDLALMSAESNTHLS